MSRGACTSILWLWLVVVGQLVGWFGVCCLVTVCWLTRFDFFFEIVVGSLFFPLTGAVVVFLSLHILCVKLHTQNTNIKTIMHSL